MSTNRRMTFPQPSSKRTEVMTFRASPEERALIIRFASDLGMPISEPMRHYVVEAAKIFYGNDLEDGHVK